MPVLKILNKIGAGLSFFVFQRAHGLRGSGTLQCQSSLQETLKLHVLGPTKHICPLYCLGLGNQVGSLEFALVFKRNLARKSCLFLLSVAKHSSLPLAFFALTNLTKELIAFLFKFAQTLLLADMSGCLHSLCCFLRNDQVHHLRGIIRLVLQSMSNYFSGHCKTLLQLSAVLKKLQVLYKHYNLCWSSGIRWASMKIASVSQNTGLLF